MTPDSNKNKHAYLKIIVSVFALLVYFSFFFYTHPIGDDFVNSSSVIKNGVLQTCNDLFFGWSGRYSSNLILSLNPMVLGSYLGYQFSLILVLLHLLLSFY